ncbi:hypothetical protein [Altererythrobacter lauratis]|uniref:Uncharacterized protein n=1 Tax=Alteraurantiacibacter lauratis TaxID=2054627 RepID=A0ABV7EEY2_9SPHN
MVAGLAISFFFTVAGFVAALTVGRNVMLGIARSRAILRELAALDAAHRQARPVPRTDFAPRRSAPRDRIGVAYRPARCAAATAAFSVSAISRPIAAVA